MLRPEVDQPAFARPVFGVVESPLLHVMSFNLRNAGDGLPDPWADRRPVTTKLLGLERPTVIGTQEGLFRQVRQVASDLPSTYEWIGTGRDGGSRGEFMAIYFDASRLEPQEFDHFWLSDTPDVVGSTTWGNNDVRMATWVRFEDRATGKQFVLLNTHLDHAIDLAQRRGAELLAERIRPLAAELPVVVTGDFNVAAEASEPYKSLVGGGLLKDSWRAATHQLGHECATFHSYRGVAQGDRIDWILTRPDVRVESAAINTFHLEGAWASDHWPVQALLEL